MLQENQVNEFKGFSLFNDIEDEELQARNRAVVLSNIAEDYTNKERKINAKGAALILGYFSLIPSSERLTVKERFTENLLRKGYKLAN